MHMQRQNSSWIAETGKKSSSDNSEREKLRLQEARREVIIAVEFNIVEGRRHAVPSGHRGSLRAAHMRHRGHNHISAAQWPAHKDDLKFNRSANS
jgi:hypothetical protein